MISINENVRGIVISDEHSPYVDKKALALSLKIIKYTDPDILILNGDQLDFYDLSVYSKNPLRVNTLQDEIYTWQNEILTKQLDALNSKARVIKTPGNHEERLIKYLWKNPELFSLESLKMENILNLSKYGVEYAENGVLFDDCLYVYHGERVSKHSGFSAKAEMERLQHTWSTITGHVHRTGNHIVSKPNGEIIKAVENPCLCELTPEYSSLTNWQQGITYFEVFSGKVYIQPILFERDYTCIFGTKNFFV